MQVNKEKCVGCGCCASGICPMDAIKIVDGKSEIDQTKCVNCGTCASMCPLNAIM